MLSSLAPARRRLVLVLSSLLVAAVAAVVIAVIVTRRGSVAAVPQAVAGPVVLVPGYGGSTTGLDALARTLRAAGKDATVFPLPGDGRGDLLAQARALGRTVRAVLDRTGDPAVDLVGYSAGGVVARLWVRDEGGAELVRRVVTLGSPQHGTDIAALAGSILPGACPTACQQLATGSPLLAALNAGDETPAGPTFVSIWTTHDDVVLPPDSASLEGALDFTVQRVCPGDRVDHSGLPTDPGVEAIVVRELAAGPAVAAQNLDCLSS
jgi:triacylglycerol esterase/lipase EstA (alpha/beta hydrolase family)